MTARPRVLVVLGTRPEAIKLAPVIHAARAHEDWTIRVCDSGQHADLVPAILESVGLEVDVRFGSMSAGQGLDELLATLYLGLDEVVGRERPSWLVGQGDTTTVLAAALVADHHRIPFAHVEAGLRTGDCSAPFPEETNRTLVSRLAALHLAPSVRAVSNLRAEGIAATDIELTGNTVVDALRVVLRSLPSDGLPPPGAPAALARFRGALDERPVVFVTGHRRESFSGGLAFVCEAIGELARRHRGIEIVFPVHPNPSVQAAVQTVLGGQPNVHLLPPLDYRCTAWLMQRARIIVTDSGGIQEEAPELGKPVIVTRPSTERPESVRDGNAVVVGYDAPAVVALAERWLFDDEAYASVVPRHNPFGDGLAGRRCVAALRRRLRLPAEPLVVFAGDGKRSSAAP